MAKEKQIIKRLTFSEDEAEQTLVATAEARVAAGDFPTFTDLCKAALQTFLNPDAAPPPITPATEPMTGQLAQIEQTIVTLLHDLQAEQQAMGAEVRHLTESFNAELTRLQVQQAPVNGFHQLLVTKAPPANPTVNEETINRLARFLEDF